MRKAASLIGCMPIRQKKESKHQHSTIVAKCPTNCPGIEKSPASRVTSHQRHAWQWAPRLLLPLLTHTSSHRVRWRRGISLRPWSSLWQSRAASVRRNVDGTASHCLLPVQVLRLFDPLGGRHLDRTDAARWQAWIGGMRRSTASTLCYVTSIYSRVQLRKRRVKRRDIC